MDVEGKTVLVRVDYNVTFRPGTTEISDDSRIRASIPTIKLLMSQSAKIVLCSHLGRPKGMFVKNLRMTSVRDRLAEILDRDVSLAPGVVGPEVADLVASSPQNSIILLDNLRFNPGEETNDIGFSEQLASLADVYVNDAFGTAHRAHASTQGVTQFHPDSSAVGLLVERELEMLGKALENPERPFTVVLGGAKVSDKIGIIEHLSEKVDTFLIGGGMAAAFLKANGVSVGASDCADEDLDHARNVIQMSEEKGFKLLLPSDVIVGESFHENALAKAVDSVAICDSWLIMDIGENTSSSYARELRKSNTVFWNGPMGVFEWDSFSNGSSGIANTLAEIEATSIIGGGSTADIVYTLGLDDRISHVSTGGGATLEYLEGRELPGVAAIPDA
jgi:3-phosphoglycerate kinase